MSTWLGDSPAHTNTTHLGVAFFSLRMWTEAELFLGNRSRSGETSLSIREYLGEAYINMREYKQAITVFRALIDVHPCVAYWERLAVAATGAGDVEGAIVALEKAVTSDGSSGSHRMLIELISLRGRKDSVNPIGELTLYEEAVKQSGNAWWIWQYLSDCYSSMGDSARSMTAYRRGIGDWEHAETCLVEHAPSVVHGNTERSNLLGRSKALDDADLMERDALSSANSMSWPQEPNATWAAVINKHLNSPLSLSLQFTLEHTHQIGAVQFSSDGKYVASGTYGTAHVFDSRSGTKLISFREEFQDFSTSLVIAVYHARLAPRNHDASVL